MGVFIRASDLEISVSHMEWFQVMALGWLAYVELK